MSRIASRISTHPRMKFEIFRFHFHTNPYPSVATVSTHFNSKSNFLASQNVPFPLRNDSLITASKLRSHSLWPYIIGITGLVASSSFMALDENLKNSSRTFCDQFNSDSNSKFQEEGTDFENSHPLWRSEANIPLEYKFNDALIFCGTSNKVLGEKVAHRLGMKLGQVQVKRFADGEVFMQFLDSMRGKDVFLIQPTSPPVNDNLMELLLMISTCRRSSAKKITVIMPYYGYARQDRKLSSRVPISAADVACMIEAMGVDRVVAIDLHCGQIQGFFRPHVPVDNLEAQIIGLDHFQYMNLNKPIVISPDAGGVYRAKKFQEGLISKGVDCGIAMLIKQRIKANEVESMELVGRVDGSDVIIVDDMIDTASTLCEAARVLKRNGAKRVYAFATHGLFSGSGLQKIEDSPLDQVVVTDSIKARSDIQNSSKITILSVSTLIADAIRRIHQKESLTELFNRHKPV